MAGEGGLVLTLRTGRLVVLSTSSHQTRYPVAGMGHSDHYQSLCIAASPELKHSFQEGRGAPEPQEVNHRGVSTGDCLHWVGLWHVCQRAQDYFTYLNQCGKSELHCLGGKVLN